MLLYINVHGAVDAYQSRFHQGKNQFNSLNAPFNPDDLDGVAAGAP